jgi:Bacterial regulatory proteins, luxR family
MHLRFLTGRDFFPVADMQEAVELASVDPQSPEYALAVAELVDAELWHDVPTAPARAEEAVRLARACGSDRALTYALVAWVMSRVMTDEAGRFEAGIAVAEEARAAAVRNRDFFGFVHATLWAANCLEIGVSWEYVDYLRRSREQMTGLGAPHSYIAWLCADEASGLLLLGDWRSCEDRLRVALGSPPGPLGDIDARLAAALQACWQGRQAEADAHLARAEEPTTPCGRSWRGRRHPGHLPRVPRRPTTPARWQPMPLPLPAAAQHAGRRRARVPVVGVTRRRLGGPDRTAALQPLARTHTPRPKSPRVSARSLRTSWLAAPTRRSRALVVSEKTVSVHVSNMLRKTGTGNRVELAQLARLLTSPAHGPRLS